MPQRTYNRFTKGVEQDDFLTNGPGFIDQKNIDGLRDGYALHLGPKVNKGIITNGIVNSLAFDSPNDTVDLDESLVGGGNVLYKMNSTDLTPAYTFTDAGADVKQIIYHDNYYYVIYDPTTGSGKIARFRSSDVRNGTFSSVEENFLDLPLSVVRPQPYIIIGNKIYIGMTGSVIVIDMGNNSIDTFSFPDTVVVGMTFRGTVLMVYTRSGNVYQWDGINDSYSAIVNMPAIVNVSKGYIYDFIRTVDGQMYIGQGLSMQPLFYPKISNRMNDNASYNTRLDFSLSDRSNQNNVSISALDKMYLACNDSVAGIYKYGKLTTEMRSGIHKVVTENHAGTQIDVIYDMYFLPRGDRYLYFSYKAGSTYGVDYIDLGSLETTTDGYAITEVFAGGTASYKKTIKKLLRSTSNTSGDNYIHIHYRINNGAWILIEDINDDVDSIIRDEIHKEQGSNAFRENIDVQFKVSLHNHDGGVNSPALHELVYDYNAK